MPLRRCVYTCWQAALFRSRVLATFAAVAYSVFPSPAYLMPSWRAISQPYAHAPWGFVTLVAFDEAAHTFALPFMLLAAAMAWRKRWTLAAVLAGAVFLTSWPALIGLGFVMAGIAVANSRDLGPARAAASVVGLIGTAYGLSAFWMTPGNFVSSTLLNRIVLRHTLPAAPWSGTSWIILAVALALIAISFWRRVPQRLCRDPHLGGALGPRGGQRESRGKLPGAFTAPLHARIERGQHLVADGIALHSFQADVRRRGPDPDPGGTAIFVPLHHSLLEVRTARGGSSRRCCVSGCRVAQRACQHWASSGIRRTRQHSEPLD